ncbi:tyrosine-type recombinase/integrase [Pontiellaceae bacterium B12227]|nr:tyrosine-type recombinase/integrase [Pontiellaceae bacterium B12227]
MSGRKRNLKASFTKHGYEYCEGFLIRRIETVSGIRFQVDLGKQGGKYVRKSFRTKSQARECAELRKRELDNHGIVARNLPEEQRIDALEALDRLQDYGVTLLASADYYIKHHQEVSVDNGLSPLIERYLTAQLEKVNKEKLRKRSYDDMIKRLKPFKDKLGHMAIDAIEGKDIDRLMDANGYEDVNRRNYKRYLSVFFNWAVKNKLTPSNPVLDTEFIDVVKRKPRIYTPAQTKKIMKKAEELRPELVPYLSIAFFAGIRPEEITRLTWQDIDLEIGDIHLKPEQTKTHAERIVHIHGNLREWLARYWKDKGLVFPYSESSLKRWRSEIYRKAEVDSIQDGARHSFATFYLALNTIEDTLEELGHSDTQMLFRHYKGLAKNRKEQAKKYFDTRPPAGVIEFPAARKGVA